MVVRRVNTPFCRSISCVAWTCFGSVLVSTPPANWIGNGALRSAMRHPCAAVQVAPRARRAQCEEMLRAMIIAVLMTGCAAQGVTDEVDEAVKSCRAAAQTQCDTLGFGTSTTCVLVFAKFCSAEDEENAREECVIEEGLPADAPCCLKWR